MTTIDNIMALADAYAEEKQISVRFDSGGFATTMNAQMEVINKREALRTALTKALAQPNHSEQHLDMVGGNVQAQPVAPIKEVVVNADYREMWAQQVKINQQLTSTLSQPAQRTAGCTLCGYCAATGEKIQAAQPAREPSCETCKHCTVASYQSFEETCLGCSQYYDNKYEAKN